MLLALLLAGFVAALALRKPLALDVIHDRNTLYRLLDDGQVENVYLLKIMNKGQASREFAVSLEESTGFRLDPRSPRFTVGAGEVFNAAVRVRRDAWNDQPDHAAAEDAGEVGSADRDEAHAGERAARGDIDELHFILTATDEPGLQARAEARFFGPHQ
jgi:hypothetical protein